MRARGGTVLTPGVGFTERLGLRTYFMPSEYPMSARGGTVRAFTAAGCIVYALDGHTKQGVFTQSTGLSEADNPIGCVRSRPSYPISVSICNRL